MLSKTLNSSLEHFKNELRKMMLTDPERVLGLPDVGMLPAEGL